MSIYQITDDFQLPIEGFRIIVLDRDLALSDMSSIMSVDGADYGYHWNHNRRWVTIRSTESFKGKTAVFTKRTQDNLS